MFVSRRGCALREARLFAWNVTAVKYSFSAEEPRVSNWGNKAGLRIGEKANWNWGKCWGKRNR
eukprot:717164-Prorocentrum_minimum.AAC.1